MSFPKPWSVQIELVEGCQRRCRICGINNLVPKGQFKFMSFETAAEIAKGVSVWSPSPRLEFAMHGEPLLHPHLKQMLTGFRKVLPDTQFQVTTNGMVLFGNMDKYFDALKPANVIILDVYSDYADKLKSRLSEWVKGQSLWKCVDFYDGTFNPYHNHGNNGHTIVVMDDIAVMSGKKKQRRIWNHVGYNADHTYLKEPLTTSCVLPLREMGIRWDGSVAVCCMDWGAEYLCGVVSSSCAVKDVWSSDAFMAARRLLVKGKRVFRPCLRCNYDGGMRKGLIPQVLGDTEEDKQTVERVNKESPSIGIEECV
jgi:hypothetical protein